MDEAKIIKCNRLNTTLGAVEITTETNEEGITSAFEIAVPNNPLMNPMFRVDIGPAEDPPDGLPGLCCPMELTVSPTVMDILAGRCDDDSEAEYDESEEDDEPCGEQPDGCLSCRICSFGCCANCHSPSCEKCPCDSCSNALNREPRVQKQPGTNVLQYGYEVSLTEEIPGIFYICTHAPESLFDGIRCKTFDDLTVGVSIMSEFSRSLLEPVVSIGQPYTITGDSDPDHGVIRRMVIQTQMFSLTFAIVDMGIRERG